MKNQRSEKIWKIIEIVFITISIILILYTCWQNRLIFVLITASLFVHFFLRDRKTKAQVKKYERKLYSLDRDIKTLHTNQKMLQSSIKEIYKDLKIYGEIKRAKINSGISEKEES